MMRSNIGVRSTGDGENCDEFMAMRIRQARLRSKHSQASLAAQIGVQRSAVAQWERQSGSKPAMGNLVRLARVTQCRVEWLTHGRGPSTDEATSTDSVVKDCAWDYEEAELLKSFRTLPVRTRKALLDLVLSMTPKTRGQALEGLGSHPRSGSLGGC